MMNATQLNQILHDGIRDRYQAKVGTTIEVALPKLPFTPETEFVQFDLSTSQMAPFEVALPDHGEGTVLPRYVLVHAVRIGTGKIKVTAMHALTQRRIPNVQTLEIELTIDA